LLPGIAAFCAAMLVALMGVLAFADTPNDQPSPPPVPKSGTVKIQVVGTNDLHGYLEPTGGLGGAGYLSAYLKEARGEAPGHTITVHAGDMIGASPLISTYFNHASTVAAINKMGFDVGTVGNHEFDHGGAAIAKLLQGVKFPYISANVEDLDGNLRLPPYKVIERAGVKVGFIGVTTNSATRYILPRFADRLRFGDMSDAVNRVVPELQRQGVQAIVVLAHSGGYQQGGPGSDAAGEVVDEAKQMSPAVDAIISAHTHSFLNTRVDGKLLVQSYAFGTAIDKVQLTIDRATGDVVASSADVPRTSHTGVTPDPVVDRIVKKYKGIVDPVSERFIIDARRSYSREQGNLGKIVAAAQRSQAHAEIGFVNPGNMRADLSQGRVTYGALCAIEAYGHPVMRMKLRGADFPELLEEQWTPGQAPTLLYTSGIHYDRDGDGVKNVTGPDGRPLDPDRLYTVGANELIATGDRFPVLRDRARDKVTVGTDVDALVSYLQHHPRALR
jgi:5'-nucleotidase